MTLSSERNIKKLFQLRLIYILFFYSFDLSCPMLEKDNFIENLYIVLYYWIVFLFTLVYFYLV